MARFALLINGAFVRHEHHAARPDDIAHKAVTYLPSPPVAQPTIDPLTEVIEGPTYTIGAQSVVEAWTTRPKTAEEIDADKNSALAGLNSPYAPILKILRNHENRIRLLENAAFGTNKPALSLAEVKAAIKALL